MEENLLTQRKTSKKDEAQETPQLKISKDNIKFQPDTSTLTLIEEVFLLGLNSKGHTSFWNTSFSAGLRGCILVELGFLGRIELETSQVRRKKLQNKLVKFKSDEPVDDPLMGEALKHIKSATSPETLQNWIEYLSGESWNLLKLGYAMKNVRERVAKGLVEKGILTTSKENFLVFDLITHPIISNSVKAKLIGKIQNALLVNWVNDPQRFDQRTLALIYLAHASEVLEDALQNLQDSDYDLATGRIDDLVELNFELESMRHYSNDILWGVLSAFFR